MAVRLPLACVAAGLLSRHAAGLDNGLGLTPPMGWSSWNVFAGGIDEAKIMSTIDAMAELKSAGYQYVNVDDNWMEPKRAANGSLVYRADKFPRGMKVLADHAHQKGLGFGIYSAHGARTCMGNAASGGDEPHWQQDADLFASWGVDYLKLDSCGGYEKNYSADVVGRQYANYAAMRDALNATGRPIYYSICEINAVAESDAVKNSPSACGKTSAYTSLPWHAQPDKYPVPELANSVLIEWVNNNNHFCVPGKPGGTTQAHALTLQECKHNDPDQAFTMEADGSIRQQGLATRCLDVHNCDKTDGTAVAVWQCHPNGTAECGYKNQQYEVAESAIKNVNSGTCLTASEASAGATVTISACETGDAKQAFALKDGAVHGPGGLCLAHDEAADTGSGHCCASGWVSQIDSQQDLTIAELSGPGFWNDNDMLSVACNNATHNGTAGTPCAGYQSMLEQRGQFALWCIQASPLILGHDVRTMGPAAREIITNPDMIALNQDPLGHRGSIVFQSDPYNRTLTTFVKKLADATSPRAASMFNRGEESATMTLTRTQMGFASGSCACVTLTDLDTHKEVASKVTAETLYTAPLLPHEVRTVRAKCC